MDTHNESRLVPGPGRPPDLKNLRKLSSPKPSAAGSPSSARRPPLARARRGGIRRAEPAWAGAMALFAVLAAVTALVILDRSGVLGSLPGGRVAPALSHASLGAKDNDRFWALAEYEPARFAGLLGVERDDPARMEENARKLERLLSERSNFMQ